MVAWEEGISCNHWYLHTVKIVILLSYSSWPDSDSNQLGKKADNKNCRCNSSPTPREFKTPPPPSLKCVLRESLSVDSQNIPCATLKNQRRRSWLISACLCPHPTPFYSGLCSIFNDDIYAILLPVYLTSQS